MKIKVNIFIDIFEVKDHHLCMEFAVNWWWQSFLGIPAKSQLGATPPKQNLPSETDFPPPRKGMTHPERVATDFKNQYENINVYV